MIEGTSNYLLQGFNLFSLPVIVSEQSPEKLGSTVDSLREQLQELEAAAKAPISVYAKTQFSMDTKEMRHCEGSDAEEFAIVGIETHM